MCDASQQSSPTALAFELDEGSWQKNTIPDREWSSGSSASTASRVTVGVSLRAAPPRCPFSSGSYAKQQLTASEDAICRRLHAARRVSRVRRLRIFVLLVLIGALQYGLLYYGYMAVWLNGYDEKAWEKSPQMVLPKALPISPPSFLFFVRSIFLSRDKP